MSTLAYEIVDVFTDRPFTGNPLAVVFGAEALAGDQMQALAREFNLSETVFVLPPTRGRGDLPGADLHARRASCRSPATRASAPRSPGCAAGLFAAGDGRPGVRRRGCCRSTSPRTDGPTLTGGTATVGARARPGAAAGGGRADGRPTSPAPRRRGGRLRAGVPVPAGTARRGGPRPGRLDGRGRSARTASACSPGTTATASAHVTGLLPRAVGVPEDPATGSAALGLGVWLVAGGLLPRRRRVVRTRCTRAWSCTARRCWSAR